MSNFRSQFANDNLCYTLKPDNAKFQWHFHYRCGLFLFFLFFLFQRGQTPPPCDVISVAIQHHFDSKNWNNVNKKYFRIWTKTTIVYFYCTLNRETRNVKYLYVPLPQPTVDTFHKTKQNEIHFPRTGRYRRPCWKKWRAKWSDETPNRRCRWWGHREYRWRWPLPRSRRKSTRTIPTSEFGITSA